MKSHHRKHTGEKTWLCDQCHALFLWRSGLRTHIDRGRCPRTPSSDAPASVDGGATSAAGGMSLSSASAAGGGLPTAEAAAGEGNGVPPVTPLRFLPPVGALLSSPPPPGIPPPQLQLHMDPALALLAAAASALPPPSIPLPSPLPAEASDALAAALEGATCHRPSVNGPGPQAGWACQAPSLQRPGVSHRLLPLAGQAVEVTSRPPPAECPPGWSTSAAPAAPLPPPTLAPSPWVPPTPPPLPPVGPLRGDWGPLAAGGPPPAAAASRPWGLSPQEAAYMPAPPPGRPVGTRGSTPLLEAPPAPPAPADGRVAAARAAAAAALAAVNSMADEGEWEVVPPGTPTV